MGETYDYYDVTTSGKEGRRQLPPDGQGKGVLCHYQSGKDDGRRSGKFSGTRLSGKPELDAQSVGEPE